MERLLDGCHAATWQNSAIRHARVFRPGLPTSGKFHYG